MLLVTSGEGASESRVGRALRAEIDARPDLEEASLARLATLAARDLPRSTEAAELEADRRLAQAEAAFSEFDYAGATTALREALELLRPLAARAAGRRRLADVHVRLALVLQVHGEEGAALDELRTCLHVDPECAPDPARHPPELIALFARVRAEPDPRASLRVETTPARAHLTLDGAREAESPTTWEDVSVGRHYVTVSRDGFLPEVHVVQVSSGERTTRALALTEGPPPLRASAAIRALEGAGPDAERRWRREAATLAEADVLLVLRLAAGARLAAFDGRGAPLGEPRDGDRADAALAQGFLEEVLPAPSLPFYGQWWFWTPIAFVVAVGFAALTFAVVNVPDVQLLGGEVIRE